MEEDAVPDSIELHPLVLELCNEIQQLRRELSSAKEMCTMLQHQTMQDLKKRRRRRAAESKRDLGPPKTT